MKRGWTKRQLAEAAGISYGYLWRPEAARQDPDADSRREDCEGAAREK